MLTPKDLLDASLASGYRYVNHVTTHGHKNRPFHAQKRIAAGDQPGNKWIGPRRATAEEAAQDYCDWINGLGVTPATALKSAGHAGKRRRLSDDPEVEAALGVLRDARGQREGKQGYVYCISDGTALKVGFSTNPNARLAELQTGNPRKLSLLGKISGTLEDEAALHQKYIKENILQEWFRLTPQLLSEFDK